MLLGVGWLITQIAPGTQAEAGDLGVVRWLAAHRTAGLDVVSAWAADLGATIPVFALGLVAATLALAALRRWWPVVLLAVGLVGELALFLTTAMTIDRPRPPVSHLDAALPPTSSFPSGHTGAAICLYGGVALIIFVSTRSWWRWLAVAVAFALVITIALARLYRGAHFLTDVLGSVLLALPWLLMVARVVRPPHIRASQHGHVEVQRSTSLIVRGDRTGTRPLRPATRRRGRSPGAEITLSRCPAAIRCGASASIARGRRAGPAELATARRQ